MVTQDTNLIYEKVEQQYVIIEADTKETLSLVSVYDTHAFCLRIITPVSGLF